ncbi:MAG: cytosine permease [Nitrososphaeraceae archaeon]
MNFIKNCVQWGIDPVPRHNRLLRGREFFVLWSSLGVGLLVFSAGSFLSDASFVDAFLAILIGSVGGSILLALAGKIGSDNAIPSLVSMRPSFGIRGSYLPAALNVVQLLGWTIFEITIMSTAAHILVGKIIPFYVWTIIFGSIITLMGLIGPLAVVRQWLEKFAIWAVYASSIIIIIILLLSDKLSILLSTHGNGMSFFTSLDIVIAMPVSWMPLAADYNRFAKNSNSAFKATMIGFAMTNVLFYLGGVLLGTSDIIIIIGAIQSMLFGFLMLVLIVDETDNTFADVYSAAVSSQNIFPKLDQRVLIIGFTAFCVIMANIIPIAEYQTFLLLIGAVFVPLFGVVLSDYYILKRFHYSHDALFNKNTNKIGYPAFVAWSLGVLVYYLLSSLSPIYMPDLPQIGATIPSLVVSSAVYMAMMYSISRFRIKRVASQ